MSLIAGVWSNRVAGVIQAVLFTDIPVGDRKFNGGTPADITGKALVAPQLSGYNIETFLGGLGYNSDAIVVDSINPIISRHGGIPMTELGLAIEVGGVPASYVAGIPLSASGRVCMETVAPINLHAFDSGFDQGAFN